MLNSLLLKYKSIPLPLRASFWFFVSTFLQTGINAITTPIFTRLLSTAEYGQFSVFNSWSGIVSVFVTMNLSWSVFMQGLVKFGDRKSQFASALQGLCFTMTAGWTVVYLLFHEFWNRLFTLTTVQMLAMLVMAWTSSVFGFWSAEQRVELQYRRLVAVSLAASVAKPCLGVLFVVLAEDKVTARILSLALVELAAYSWSFFAQMRRGKKFFDAFFWKYALLFNLPLIPHYLSMTVLNSSDRIMINSMVGPDEAGIYSLAYSVSQVMTVFNTALLQSIEPWLYKKIKEQRVEDMASVAYPAFLLIAAVNIALIALAPEVIAFFAPASYYQAIWIIPPAAMSVYFMFAYTFFSVFEFYYEKTKYITLATFSGAALNVLLNYIFIGLFGYYAAGYTTLFCYMVFALYHFYFMRRICRTELGGASPYSAKVLLGITSLFMALGFAFLLTYASRAARYALIAVILAALIVKRERVFAAVKHLLGLRREK